MKKTNWSEHVKKVRRGEVKRARVTMGSEASANVTMYRLRKKFSGVRITQRGAALTIQAA